MENICISITILVYLALVVYIGVRCSKKNKNTDDFYLGGRKLGPLVTAMSAEASDMSSWLLMGLPGLAYLTGLADATWTAIGLAVGTYLNWLIVSKRIRRYSQRIDAITVPDFISRRYGDRRNLLNFIAALVIIIFFVPYTASGFAACGKLFSSLFGVNYFWAMLVSAIVIVAYTALGGFLAASTTDLIQSIIMTIALAVVMGFAIFNAGGINVAFQNIKELPGFLSMTATHDYQSTVPKAYNALTIFSTMAWGLGYFGMPHILLRFMAIEDERKLKLSRRVASVWVVISMGVAILIGIFGLAMTQFGTLTRLSDSERIVVELAKMIGSNGIFPALIAGVILAGILAATMSTADSQLLAAASSVSQNIMQDFFGIKMSSKKSMLVARGSVIVISAVAVVLAANPNSSVFKVVSFAWAGFGAAFGPVILCALFWKNSNQWGALAGMLSGGIMVFIWKFALRPLGGLWDIYELLPAFLIGLLANVVVSLATGGQKDREILKIFQNVKSDPS